MHIHVSHTDGEAKFWLSPTVHLALSTGLSAPQIKDAQKLIEDHIVEIQNAWASHFGA